jgi:hypothetical protein
MNITAMPAARAAYSVRDFCVAHGITKVLFYKLIKDGVGPRIMKIGRRTLISVESATEWRRHLEETSQVLPSRRRV